MINKKIPLLGFGTEIKDSLLKEIINKLLNKEKLTLRNFINKQIPELSLEGSNRDAFVEIKALKLLQETDNLIKLQFRLQKGSYATVAIDFLLK